MKSIKRLAIRSDAGDEFTLWLVWSTAFLLLASTHAVLLLISLVRPVADWSSRYDMAQTSWALTVALALAGLLYSSSAARSCRDQWLVDHWFEASWNETSPAHSHWVAAVLFLMIVFMATLLPQLL